MLVLVRNHRRTVLDFNLVKIIVAVLQRKFHCKRQIFRTGFPEQHIEHICVFARKAAFCAEIAQIAYNKGNPSVFLAVVKQQYKLRLAVYIFGYLLVLNLARNRQRHFGVGNCYAVYINAVIHIMSKILAINVILLSR